MGGCRTFIKARGHAICPRSTTALRLSFAFKHEDFDATLRVVYTRSTPTNIGIVAYGLNPDGTQADGVNPRLNPYTGAQFGLHQGAYDNSRGIHEGARAASLASTFTQAAPSSWPPWSWVGLT
jgi:hypothetical protein